MDPLVVLEKKRNGDELSPGEIDHFLTTWMKGGLSDAQMSAFLMAVYFRGMSLQETIGWTRAMVDSGHVLDFHDDVGFYVDKHSTGGVGDTITLISLPLVAACGLPVVKMSGASLGHTGGTLDKLQSIPGFRTELTPSQIRESLRQTDLAVFQQSPDVVPADQRLYALRNQTATVESLPLVVSSVMSKKVATGASGLLLDVKYGSGAFFPQLAEAERLAGQLVAVGRAQGMVTVALLTHMDQPLGYAVGNRLEVEEAMSVLQGEGAEDLRALAVEVAAQMLRLREPKLQISQIRPQVLQALNSGQAYECFLRWIRTQGGDLRKLEHRLQLAEGRVQCPVTARQEGYVSRIDARAIGQLAMQLGARKDQHGILIDPDAGVVLRKKVGDRVTRDEPLLLMQSRQPNAQDLCANGYALAQAAYSISPHPPVRHPLIHSVLAP